jgi:hypothetical protein
MASRAPRDFPPNALACSRRSDQERGQDGADYSVLPEAGTDDDGFSAHWEVRRMVLQPFVEASGLLRCVFDDFAKPCANTLGRWLQTAVSAGLVLMEGRLAAEARWHADPMFEFYQIMVRNSTRVGGVPLRAKKRGVGNGVLQDFCASLIQIRLTATSG